MDGHGQNIGPVIKNILLSVSVMIVNVQNRHPSLFPQILGSRCCAVQVAEPAKGPAFCMMSGRPHKVISNPFPVQQCLCCDQCRINGAPGRRIGIPVNRGKGINAIISRQHGRFTRRAHSVPDGKNIGIKGFFFVNFLTGPQQKSKKIRIVDTVNMTVGKRRCLHTFKKTALLKG